MVVRIGTYNDLMEDMKTFHQESILKIWFKNARYHPA
jgi:hypothetical protein